MVLVPGRATELLRRGTVSNRACSLRMRVLTRLAALINTRAFAAGHHFPSMRPFGVRPFGVHPY